MGSRVKRKILVICKGNVCRSAFAAAWMRAYAPTLGLTVQIRSAGTEGHHAGDPAHPTAILVAKEFGIDLCTHVAHRVTAHDVIWSDVVVAMDNENIRRLKEVFPSETERKAVQLLGAGLEIQDPDRKPIENFRDCFKAIVGSSEVFLRARGRLNRLP